MSNGFFYTVKAINETVVKYEKDSIPESQLKAKINELKDIKLDIPLIIGGYEVRTGNTKKCIIPHDHGKVIAEYHLAGKKEIKLAIEAALEAKNKWENINWQHRLSVFLKAAELLSGPWRSTLNAATILCQSKTSHQAEIDAACELVDFFRFNVDYAQEIYRQQPISTNAAWNRIDYRPLEGFVLAITPFNFTAIGGNLAAAPALMGNTVLWKPASTSVYSNYFVMMLLQEAGLPDGVINFVPCDSKIITTEVINNKHLSGIHFTGSTEVFNSLWKNVANNIEIYKDYPRIVGETGGKDFIFAHQSCDIEELSTALVRGAFEYQGQKCSAVSRAYIPKSIWEELRVSIVEKVNSIKVGNVEDFENFMGAVIDKKAFDRCKSYIEYTKASQEAEILIGGNCSDAIGYFVDPTVIVTSEAHFKTMVEEIFGPILTLYLYNVEDIYETLQLCNHTSNYGLTGAIFSKDREVIEAMEKTLRYSAGNFYINDKPTGAVVGQQPFGGGRKSGTNDKAGSILNLLRWTSPRTIKETFVPERNGFNI